MFNLATLFVDIRADQGPLNNALSGVRNQLTGANVALGTFLGNMATMAVRGAAALGGGLFDKTIGSAMNMGETMDKVQVIMGNSAGKIISEADRLSERFGVSKQQYIDAASSFGAAFKGIGKSQDEAAGLGNQLAQLGLDLASLYNSTNPEAFTALQAAMRGEFDPLERFNIFLTAAAVTNEALSMGLIKTASGMTDAAKKAATLSLIMKQSADAQGNLELTQDSAANATRRFWGMLDNLGQSIGQTLMPAYTALINVGTEVARSLSGSFEGARVGFEGWVQTVVDGIGIVGVIFRNLGDLWEITVLTIGAGVSNAIAEFNAFGQNVFNIFGWIGENIVNVMVDAFTLVTTMIQNFGTNLGKAFADFMANPLGGGFNFNWTPLAEGFKSTTTALPELIKPDLINVDGQIADIQTRMADREAARLSAKGAATGLAGKTEAQLLAESAMRTEPGGAAADKFKSEIMGSAEFASKLRMAQGSEDVPAKSLTELQQIRELETRSVEMLEKALNNQVAILG